MCKIFYSLFTHLDFICSSLLVVLVVLLLLHVSFRFLSDKGTSPLVVCSDFDKVRGLLRQWDHPLGGVLLWPYWQCLRLAGSSGCLMRARKSSVMTSCSSTRYPPKKVRGGGV